tara:strand:+ start:803 stop:979 length:177 start_codon:yes stop_codon:yes gene_type:complete
MRILPKKQELTYRQGVANLKLEGMSLTAEQDQIARSYHAGKLTKQQMVKKALAYARTR